MNVSMEKMYELAFDSILMRLLYDLEEVSDIMFSKMVYSKNKAIEYTKNENITNISTISASSNILDIYNNTNFIIKGLNNHT